MSVAVEILQCVIETFVCRLKNVKKPHFVRPNNELRTLRSYTNTEAGNGRSSRSAYGEQEGICKQIVSTKCRSVHSDSLIQKRMARIRELGGMLISKVFNDIMTEANDVHRPVKANTTAHDPYTNVLLMSTQKASSYGSPTPKWS